MLVFADRPDFLDQMAEQLIAHPRVEDMVGHLSSVFASIHEADPAAFRHRALSALKSGAVHVIHAASRNLRVFSGATEEDIAVIQAYAGYPDPVAKRGAIFAITYMGKFTELRQNLKEAILSIHTKGDQAVAADLADAFGKPRGLDGTTAEAIRGPDGRFSRRIRSRGSCQSSSKVHVIEIRRVGDFESGTLPGHIENSVARILQAHSRLHGLMNVSRADRLGLCRHSLW